MRRNAALRRNLWTNALRAGYQPDVEDEVVFANLRGQVVVGMVMRIHPSGRHALVKSGLGRLEWVRTDKLFPNR